MRRRPKPETYVPATVNGERFFFTRLAVGFGVTSRRCLVRWDGSRASLHIQLHAALAECGSLAKMLSSGLASMMAWLTRAALLLVPLQQLRVVRGAATGDCCATRPLEGSPPASRIRVERMRCPSETPRVPLTSHRSSFVPLKKPGCELLRLSCTQFQRRSPQQQPRLQRAR